MNNRKLPQDEQIVVGLKVATMPEQDTYQRQVMQIRAEYALDKAQELIEEKTRELAKSKFEYVYGLEIEGITAGGTMDFDTFYNEAPPELVSWILRAILSTTELTLAERKNFLPESGSAS